MDLLPMFDDLRCFLRHMMQAATCLPGKLHGVMKKLKESIWPGGCRPAHESIECAATPAADAAAGTAAKEAADEAEHADKIRQVFAKSQRKKKSFANKSRPATTSGNSNGHGRSSRAMVFKKSRPIELTAKAGAGAPAPNPR